MYHFENKENDQYYHDITFDKSMLENESDEDIVSHLYMSEAYYFNPKMLKRHQVSLQNSIFIRFHILHKICLFQNKILKLECE